VKSIKQFSIDSDVLNRWRDGVADLIESPTAQKPASPVPNP
jgi:hypothetical protein